MNIPLHVLPFFVGLGVAYVVATNVSHFDKTFKFIAISISTLCLGYFFTWFNIKMLQRTGELSARKVLKPSPFGHICLIGGALAVGYGFSIISRLFLIAGFVLWWFADDLLRKTDHATPNQATQKNRLLHSYLFMLLQYLIRDAQRSIGLVAYKVAQDRNGMVSLGDVMRQPWTFETHVSSDYNFDVKRNHGKHVVISKTDFNVIQYSSDPREGTQTRTFVSAADVARHFCSLQMTVAINESIFREEDCNSLNPKKSFEQLKRYSDLIQQHRLVLETRLDKFLSSRKARLINLLIKVLSKSA